MTDQMNQLQDVLSMLSGTQSVTIIMMPSNSVVSKKQDTIKASSDVKDKLLMELIQELITKKKKRGVSVTGFGGGTSTPSTPTTPQQLLLEDSTDLLLEDSTQIDLET